MHYFNLSPVFSALLRPPPLPYSSLWRTKQNKPVQLSYYSSLFRSYFTFSFSNNALQSTQNKIKEPLYCLEEKFTLILNDIMLLSTKVSFTCATGFLLTFHQSNPTYTLKKGLECPFLYAQKSSRAKAYTQYSYSNPLKYAWRFQ